MSRSEDLWGVRALSEHLSKAIQSNALSAPALIVREHELLSSEVISDEWFCKHNREVLDCDSRSLENETGAVVVDSSTHIN